MIPRRVALALAALLVASPALAQLTRQEKQEVLTGVDRVLTRQAFVPGVDLTRWRSFIVAREERLEAADSPGRFAAVVNSALDEFGLSHIQLSPSRMRRPRREPDGAMAYAPQRSPFGRTTTSTIQWLKDDVARIRIASFGMGYRASQIEELFEEARDARYLLLDLRGNPGGEVENMRHFLGLVLPADAPVGTFVSRRLADRFVRAGKGSANDPVAIAAWADAKFRPRRSDLDPFPGEVAVLVDSGSASAAEIVANALREFRRSPLVGSPTAGAVLVSTFQTLPHGFRIQFPLADYVSAKGRRLEGRPLTPDLAVPQGTADFDVATAALARLRARR